MEVLFALIGILTILCGAGFIFLAETVRNANGRLERIEREFASLTYGNHSQVTRSEDWV